MKRSLTIYLEDTLREWLEQAAAAEGRSVSNYLVRMIAVHKAATPEAVAPPPPGGRQVDLEEAIAKQKRRRSR